MSRKTFTSAEKLNRLPVGSKIFFGDKYSSPWLKNENGWKKEASSWPTAWDAKTVLAYNSNQKYWVETIKS